MALDSYSGLVTALESWMNRSDLTAQIPDFITLFEARMNRRLRVPQMESTVTASADSETVALPDDYLQLREVRVEDDAINAMAPQALHERYQDSSSTTPSAYSILGESLVLGPAPDTANPVDVEITYYQKIPALTSANTSNWLLADYPDSYLYGVLCLGAGAYLRDDPRMEAWKVAWDETLAEIEAEGIKRSVPAGPLTAQSAIIE